MIIDLPVRPGLRIMVTSRPVDFRRGMDSLSTLVKETLAADPFAGDVFVFRSKRADRLKILVWDGSGLVLVSKRLERGRFTRPPVFVSGPVSMRLTFQSRASRRCTSTLPLARSTVRLPFSA